MCLTPGAVQADVVGGPADAELVAAGGQLADQVGQVLVVGVAAGFGAQHGDGVVGGAFPVAPERAGVRVEEVEPGEVRPAGRGRRTPARTAPARAGSRRARPGARSRRRPGPRSSRRGCAATLGRTCRAGGRRRARRAGPGGAGEVEQVLPLGLVELQGPGRARRARSRTRRRGCRARAGRSTRR